MNITVNETELAALVSERAVEVAAKQLADDIVSRYSGGYKWYFFPAMEGLCVLLPEYSDVKEWKEIFGEHSL